MLTFSKCDRSHRLEGRAVELLMARREPRVPLYGHGCAVWEIICADGILQRIRRRYRTFVCLCASLRTGATAPHWSGRLAIPANEHQIVVRDSPCDRDHAAQHRYDRTR